MTTRFLIRYSLFNCAFMSFVFTFISVFSTKYCYDNLTNEKLAYLVILTSILGFVTMTYMAKGEVRERMVAYPFILSIAIFIFDGLTELTLLYDPIYKMIGDAISLAILYPIVLSLIKMRRIRLLNKEELEQYQMDVEKYRNLAMALGGILALFISLPSAISIVSVTIGANALICVLEYTEARWYNKNIPQLSKV